MPQIHYEQFGTFHAITNTANGIAWCTNPRVPECIIDHLCQARDLYEARLHAFCILPDHLHLILSPGPKGLSRFMQAFKSNSTKYLRKQIPGLFDQIGWKKGFYDERIRGNRQQSAAFTYVQGNAMKHGLVSGIQDWPWTSLHFPELIDPLELW